MSLTVGIVRFVLLFTALWTVIVTGFAITNRLRRWAKPISSHKLWPVIAQQVRDSAVNSNGLRNIYGTDMSMMSPKDISPPSVNTMLLL